MSWGHFQSAAARELIASTEVNRHRVGALGGDIGGPHGGGGAGGAGEAALVPGQPAARQAGAAPGAQEAGAVPVPPLHSPVMGWEQAVHRLENSWPKHSAQ